MQTSIQMINTLKKELFYAGIILIAAFIVQWYFIDYYFTSLPAHIPNTNISISGVAIVITLMAVIYFFQKKSVQKVPGITLIQLTGLSALVCVVAEIIFHAVRYIIEPGTFFGKIFWFVHDSIISVLLAVLLAFMGALQLKHPKSIWNKLIPVIILAILYFLKEFTSLLNGQLWLPGYDS